MKIVQRTFLAVSRLGEFGRRYGRLDDEYVADEFGAFLRQLSENKVLALVFGVACGAIDLRVEYSPLSGLLSRVRIDDQSLEMALDFSLEESFLFASETGCGCVDAYFEPTTTTGEVTEQAAFGWRNIIPVHARLEGKSYVFGYVSEMHPVSARFRDAAGVVGLGRNSLLTREKLIVVSVHNEDLIVQIFPPIFLPVKAESVSILVSPEDSSWSFAASILIGQELLLKDEIVFDPSEQNLVIPTRYKSLFSFLRSEEEDSPLIDLKIGETVVSISSTLLFDPASLRTRIRFEDCPHVKIGRLLVHAVESVVLDNSRSLMSLNLESTAPASVAYRSPRSSLPLLSPRPVIQRLEFGEGIQLVWSFAAGETGIVYFCATESETTREIVFVRFEEDKEFFHVSEERHELIGAAHEVIPSFSSEGGLTLIVSRVSASGQGLTVVSILEDSLTVRVRISSE